MSKLIFLFRISKPQSNPMQSDCIELIKSLARPDGICLLPAPMVFQPEHRQYTIYVFAARVSPEGVVYVHTCFHDEVPDLNNRDQWYSIDMKHYADRLMLSNLYIRLNELVGDAAMVTDSLLSELNIEKEVTA